MAEPPSYEESTAGSRTSTDRQGDRKTPQAWSIREQVGLSRTQHVALIVSQIVDHIRERAERGLSKTTLILIPSDQDATRKGLLVGFPDGDIPTMIQFEGGQNSTQFWSQDEALSELQTQLWRAVSDGMPVEPATEQLRQIIPQPPPPKKSSWFGRKSSKTPEVVHEVQPASSSSCPVTVDVQLDEVHFRSETEFGLYETLRAKAVIATVVIR